MSYTIRQLILDGMNWLIRHPKIVIIGAGPIYPPHIRSAYNTANPTLDFDTDLRNYIRSNDGTYASWSDNDLQALIEETVPDTEDVSATVKDDPIDPDNG